ncbi:toxin-antitoxin system YwqK family antitoxin [Flavobacterium orientale]|uniref:MORN repeat variant n=1 Tax=Flavobacterium orientale TaxID=1756020 RepID=A0A916Y2G9_9FLAO|nr:hypothetical protein [Flavobacterium orientale]GGD27590.1 hypothetical protein GCM10011343_17210 [Flavobacterium orientale]
MKVRYYFLFLFLIFSCKSARVASDLPQTNIKVTYYNNGFVKNVGNVEAFFAEHNSYRIGLWSEFYENGKLKSSGNYKLGTYIQCCTGGLCDEYYSYKIGEWVYYHDNGTLKAKGTYQIGEKHKKTSCEGGAKIKFGFVTDQWKFYDKDGSEIKPSSNDIAEIEKSSFIDEWDMRD